MSLESVLFMLTISARGIITDKSSLEQLLNGFAKQYETASGHVDRRIGTQIQRLCDHEYPLDGAREWHILELLEREG